MLQEYFFKCFKGTLQVLYIDVAKVDRDIAHVVMDIHVCFKCMFQMFHLFQTYVASVLSGRYKSRYGCCIYMHIVSVCFKCFIRIFANISSGYCISLQLFSNVFRRFRKCFIYLFKCFICLLLYVANIVSECFKNRSGVVHGMCVQSG
jgi:hypothetical protein